MSLRRSIVAIGCLVTYTLLITAPLRFLLAEPKNKFAQAIMNHLAKHGRGLFLLYYVGYMIILAWLLKLVGNGMLKRMDKDRN